ncbi:hypothetical protein HMPREF1346_00257 [Enterococcus faecium 503]|nr:hypothetical protein HMPREF1346_00257 [Enterococcus faecium 503]
MFRKRGCEISGCEKAVLHQVIRTVKQKMLLLFFVWLGLLPQMQAFEHRLFGKGFVTKHVTNPFHHFIERIKNAKKN